MQSDPPFLQLWKARVDSSGMGPIYREVPSNERVPVSAYRVLVKALRESWLAAGHEFEMRLHLKALKGRF